MSQELPRSNIGNYDEDNDYYFSESTAVSKSSIKSFPQEGRQTLIRRRRVSGQVTVIAAKRQQQVDIATGQVPSSIYGNTLSDRKSESDLLCVFNNINGCPRKPDHPKEKILHKFITSHDVDVMGLVEVK